MGWGDLSRSAVCSQIYAIPYTDPGLSDACNQMFIKQKGEVWSDALTHRARKRAGIQNRLNG